MLVLIYAQDINGGIGKNNDLPWQHREDLQVFRDMTIYGKVAMGRKTWESLPPNKRPLPQRTNIVLSGSYPASMDYDLVPSLEALDQAFMGDICFVIGGASVIRQALPLAKMVFRTVFEKSYDCDTFVEPVENTFLEVSSQSYEVNNVVARHCVYVKEHQIQFTQKYRFLQQRYLHSCQARYPAQDSFPTGFSLRS